MTRVARDQGLSPCPILTALAQFIQGALLLDQIPLRHRKLCARGLQLRLCPKAWEKGGHPDPTTGTSSNPGNNPRPRAAHSPQAPPPQPTCLTAAIAGSDLLFQGAQLRRLLRGWNDPRPCKIFSLKLGVLRYLVTLVRNTTAKTNLGFPGPLNDEKALSKEGQ